MQQCNGLVHSVECHPRQVDCFWQRSAGANEYGVIALFEYAVNGLVVAPYGYAGAEFHSEVFDFLDFVSHHRVWQSVLGNAVEKHTACLPVQGPQNDDFSLL